jgi:hypothetical protein
MYKRKKICIRNLIKKNLIFELSINQQIKIKQKINYI